MQTTRAGGERRRYFRIDDKVVLAYREISGEDLEAGVNRLKAGYPDKTSLASAFAVTSAQMRQAMDRVRRDQPEVATYLEGLNEKLDLLVQLLAASDNDLDGAPARAVNLSAGGISFRAGTGIRAGTVLEMKLLVFPAYACVLAFGTVVRCMPHPAGDYSIGVDFTHIRDVDRELLVRHVTQRQSVMLREARMATGDR